MDIKDIHINPRNPRYIRDERYQQLKRSIKEFPKMMKLRPIIVDNDGMILGGNMRYLAMIDLGYEEIPEGWVVKASELTEEEQRKFKIVDNIPFGNWDFDILANEWDFEELQDWGMEFPEMGEIIEADEKDDKTPELPKEPKSKMEDLYQLGNHRLLCGDATKKEDTKKLMEGKKAGMVFTDPPYAIFGSSTGVKTEVSDDNMIRPFFNILGRQCKLNVKMRGHIYICCDWRTFPVIKKEVGVSIVIKNALIWSKGEKGFAGTFYSNTYEIIAFFVNEADSHSMFKSFKEKGTPKHKLIYSSNVWNIERLGIKEREHFAQKPVELVKKAVSNSSNEGDIILDLFGGAGSTLITCEKLNRICYMMEIDPIYIDVIVERWENYTNRKAVKINK